MNVYDFDNTIYDGDSSVDFWMFCMRKNPIIVFLIPYQLWMGILYKINLIDKVRFKEAFFYFLRLVSDIEGTISLFWDKNENKIKEWYKNQQRDNDLIISASPYFLLEEICNRKGIRNLIATDVDANTGKFHSNNCYGDEKVRRLVFQYPDTTIDEFYSDSKSDLPLARLAKHAYLVKDNIINEWR